MRIKKLQIENATEIIVRDFMEDGVYPSFRLIRSRLSKKLVTYKLGKPTFKQKDLRGIADADQLNEQFNAIKTDIDIAFEATILQKNAIVTHFSESEILRKKIENSIRKTNKRINTLIAETGTKNRYLETEHITFEDMQEADLTESDAFIDVKEGFLKLNERDKLSKKIVISPSDINIKIVSPYTKLIEHGKRQHIANDNLNEAWMAEILTNQLNDRQEMIVEIIIKMHESFNNVNIAPYQFGDAEIYVEYETKEGAYRPLGDQEKYSASEHIYINSESINTNEIKVTIIKRGFDDNVKKGYRFYLGIKNISIESISYEKESTSYINSRPIPASALQVGGSLDGIITNETNASLYVAVTSSEHEPNKEDLKWQKIYDANKYTKQQELIEIDVLEEEKESARRTVPYGEKGDSIPLNKLVKSNGKSLFAEEYLQEIEDPRLYRGVAQWKCEGIYTPFKGEIPIKLYWEKQYQEKKASAVIEYQHRGNDLHYINKQLNFYRYTICVYGKREEKLPISLLNITGTYSLYINQERVVTSNNEALCLFKEGWNEITIYIHIGDIRGRKDLQPERVPYGFSIGKLDILYFLTQRAEMLPMKYVTKDNLLYNINLLDDDSYTIIDKEVLLISPVKDIEHQLVYKVKKDVEQKWLHTKVVLERKSERYDITPRIKSATIYYI